MKKIITILTAILLFFLPWQTRLIILPGMINGGYSEYGTISLYGTEILLWLIVVLLIIQYFISKPIAAPGAGKRLKIFVFLFSCFFAFLLAHPTLVTLNYARLFLEGILIFLIIRGMRESLKLTWAFVAGAALQAGLGMWQFFSQSAFASKWLGMAVHDPGTLGTFVVETASGRWLRAYGALPHPNILAGYLVAAILILIYAIQKNPSPALPLSKGRETDLPLLLKGARGDLLAAIILPVLFAGLFFTFSRSAWLALAVGIVMTVVVFRRDAKFCVSTIVPIATVFLFLSIIFWPLISTRTIADSRLEIKSSSERMSYYSEAWTLIKRHPLLGVGLGNYTRAIHDEIDATRPAYAYQPVHNIFVLALAELGALGFLIIAAAILSLLQREYPRFGNRGGGILRKIIPWKKAIYFAPFLIVGLFDHYLWSLYPGIILLAAYLGLIL